MNLSGFEGNDHSGGREEQDPVSPGGIKVRKIWETKNIEAVVTSAYRFDTRGGNQEIMGQVDKEEDTGLKQQRLQQKKQELPQQQQQ